MPCSAGGHTRPALAYGLVWFNAGVAGPRHDGQLLTGSFGAVVDESGQGWNPKVLFQIGASCSSSEHSHECGVDADSEQFAVGGGRSLRGQRPDPLAVRGRAERIAFSVPVAMAAIGPVQLNRV